MEDGRNEMTKSILNLFAINNVNPEDVRSRLFMIIDKYEITERTTEIAVCDENVTENYINKFILDKRIAGCSVNTLRFYDKSIHAFFRETPKTPVEVTADDIKRFIAIKDVRDGVSKTYQKDLMHCISSFYTWMVREEYIIKNPFNKIDSIKVPKVKKEAFTEMDIEKLRMNIKSDDSRMLAIFEILLSTWCRVSELTAMKISDLSENMDSVLVHGKGGKDRTCYLNARAQLALRQYLSHRRDNNIWLFPKCSVNPIVVAQGTAPFPALCKRYHVKQRNWWHVPELLADGYVDKSVVESAIRKLAKKAGVSNAHPHRFRRTGATFALRRGMPIEQVSWLLGHASIETTQIYLDISERDVELGHRKYVN